MRTLLVTLTVLLSLSLAACGEPTVEESKQLIDDGAVLIDVRTPAEYNEGYLDGALNIDFNAPDFEAQIAELPRDDSYVLYCRSGNRSGQAKAIMDQMGFTDVVNAGGYEDLR